MTATRALTIRQPWADAITHGTKRTENRSRRTHHRGPLLIHAGQEYDPMGRFHIDRSDLAAWPDQRGAIIAIATVTGCHHAQDSCCAPWGKLNVWHWQLEGVRPLAAPVPCKGRLGLWTPDTEVQTSVHEQLPAAVSGSVAARAQDGDKP